MAMANPRTGGSARAGGSSSASASSSSGLKRHGGMANLKPNSQSSENFDSSVAESHLFNLLDVTCDKIKELEDLLEKVRRRGCWFQFVYCNVFWVVCCAFLFIYLIFFVVGKSLDRVI